MEPGRERNGKANETSNEALDRAPETEVDSNGITAQETEEQGPQDPFGIDRLSVHYDYLLYRIQDYVSSIHLQTTNVCRRQNELVEQGIIGEVIDGNIEQMQKVLRQCEELENEFDKLDQIDQIVQSFHDRIKDVADSYRQLARGK
ncbi:LAMI_0E13344g1_1 [Lachancea mirantina]|uniref:Biogenesis of lysosome-related organelles complex 1 subunit CNL1 n=1 Tax=Lachancea mirantina TaxID=1230905 RepID=A0A1G4JR03_9SACH|nr:LAMI_0E13344g1_1 [Lachancea mirantina]